MAKTVNSVLKGIDISRKSIINKLHLKGFDVDENTNISELTGLFDLLYPDQAKEDKYKWTRPASWPNTREILANAEDLTINNVTYHPGYIIMFMNTRTSNSFRRTNISGTNLSYGGLAYKTSDGESFVVSAGSEVVHEWDTTQDIETDEGYKVRWCIVYTNTNKIFDSSLGAVYPAGDNSVIEIVFGDCIIKNSVNICGGSYSALDGNLISLDSDGRTTFQTKNMYISISSLEYINLPGVTYLPYPCFRSSYKLKELNLPDLVNFGDVSGTNTSSGYIILSQCYNLRKVVLPKLRSIAYPMLDYCPVLEYIDLPEFDGYVESAGVYNNCDILRNSRFPEYFNIPKCNKLAKLSYSGGSTWSGYKFSSHIILPSSIKQLYLDSIGDSSTRYIDFGHVEEVYNSSSLLSNCQVVEEINIPETLVYIQNPGSFLTGCYNLKILNIYNGWRISGFSIASCSLNRDCLLDIIDKLADVTDDTENTYTITFTSKNKSKLTADELAIGTAKGWTIN